MTIGRALTDAAGRLKAAGIDDAAIEAEVLLRHAIGLDREAFLQRLRDELPPEAGCRFDAFLERRLAHEPTAYITGQREFFGLDFEVGPAVLIPRPETELLVEAAIELGKPRGRIRRGAIIADVGSGSGAVAIACALNIPRSEVYAIDISPAALAIVESNAERHGVSRRVQAYQGDLLSPMPEFADLIVANLPYVTTEDWAGLAPEVRDHEPRAALDGGSDGLDLIRRLLVEAPRFLRPKGAVLIEFGHDQGEAVLAAAAASFPEMALEVRKDLAGHERLLLISPASAPPAP